MEMLVLEDVAALWCREAAAELRAKTSSNDQCHTITSGQLSSFVSSSLITIVKLEESIKEEIFFHFS